MRASNKTYIRDDFALEPFSCISYVQHQSSQRDPRPFAGSAKEDFTVGKKLYRNIKA